MLKLQNETKCHNINLVTPEHVVPQVIEAIYYAVEGGLNLPIVYNTSSYDSMKSLQVHALWYIRVSDVIPVLELKGFFRLFEYS